MLAINEVLLLIKKDMVRYKLLIDVRKIINKLTRMQEFELGLKLSSIEEMKGTRVALLRNPRSLENQYVNNVAVNRGYLLKEFDSKDEAVFWLNK